MLIPADLGFGRLKGRCTELCESVIGGHAGYREPGGGKTARGCRVRRAKKSSPFDSRGVPWALEYRPFGASDHQAIDPLKIANA